LTNWLPCTRIASPALLPPELLLEELPPELLEELEELEELLEDLPPELLEELEELEELLEDLPPELLDELELEPLELLLEELLEELEELLEDLPPELDELLDELELEPPELLEELDEPTTAPRVTVNAPGVQAWFCGLNKAICPVVASPGTVSWILFTVSIFRPTSWPLPIQAALRPAKPLPFTVMTVPAGPEVGVKVVT
jgi:hypothetical protein